MQVNDALQARVAVLGPDQPARAAAAALLAAMRVLTDPAETGAVTLALPQDVQAEAHDWPDELFARRVWHVPPAPEPTTRWPARSRWCAARRRSSSPAAASSTPSRPGAARLRRGDRHPGGRDPGRQGLAAVDHPPAVGAIGATGTTAANALAREADVVIGIGTRYSDFTTASQHRLRRPGVRFVNLNVAAFDAPSRRRRALVADARDGLERAGRRRWPAGGPGGLPRARATELAGEWDDVVRALATTSATGRCPAQSRGHRRRQRAVRDRATSSSAPPARCRATCTSCGGPATPRATTSSTATPAWATRSPAASA